jgi:hypothetical protein
MHDTVFLGFIIEDGFKEKKEWGKTRIPEGRYKVVKRTDSRFNPKYAQRYKHKWVLGLVDVPGFEGIVIHIGNTPEDSHGCPLINSALFFHRGLQEWHGGGSEIAYKDFYTYINALEDDDIYIIIS